MKENNDCEGIKNKNQDSQIPENCPVCGAKLESGKIQMHGGVLGFLFGGFQRPDCWFVPDIYGEERKVLRSYSSRPALSCVKCCTTIIPGKR